jgi:hypothetical protein
MFTYITTFPDQGRVVMCLHEVNACTVTTMICSRKFCSKFTEINSNKIDLTPEKDSNLFLIVSFQIVICGFIYFPSRYTGNMYVFRSIFMGE